MNGTMNDSPIYNRPGLPALAYRAGVYGSFLRRMLARLPHQEIRDGTGEGSRPLVDLTTRAADDPAIALLDAWAVAADVLTFYQERIANEGYLRTATERRSLLELARTIGYELNPGVAATAHLAFDVEDPPPAAPRGQALIPGTEPVTSALVSRNTRVQSVPGPGEQPRTYETGADFTAHVEWNALRPRLVRPQRLALFDPGGGALPELYLLGDRGGFPDGAGTALSAASVYVLDPSEPLDEGAASVEGVKVQTLYTQGTVNGLKAGEFLLLVGQRCQGEGDAATCASLSRAFPIQRLTVEPELNRTRIDLDFAPPPPPPPPKPQPKPLPAVIELLALPLTSFHVARTIKKRSWRERDLRAFMAIEDWRPDWLVRHVNWRAPAAPPPPPPQKTSVQAGAFSFAARAGFFGDNAPRWDSLPANQRFGEFATVKVDDTHTTSTWHDGAFKDSWDPNGWPIWSRYASGKPLYSADSGPADAYLDRTLPDITDHSWVVIENRQAGLRTPYWVDEVTENSLTGFALSARATGLRLADVDGTLLATAADRKPGTLTVRETTAHLQSFPLLLADLPITDAVPTGSKTQLQLSRMVLGLQVSQPVALTGERDDLPGVIAAEIAFIDEVLHEDGLTTLFFKQPLQYSYRRTTLQISANVVAATHGETVAETLGSGDGSRANQTFVLKKPPLTYVPAATASGAASTLTLRVEGVAWQEVASLYNLGPRDQGYTMEIDDNGYAHVTTGDGVHGARLPTGTENIRAYYRSGIGTAGLVGSGKLTLLQTRPLGIQGVTNPVASSGAADPESRDDARRNAPRTVLTLDRIVSLRDFEDFSRAFAGISKAQAEPLWQGERHLVFVSVAAASASGKAGNGTLALDTHVVTANSDLYDKLVTAMQAAADPVQPFKVISYEPLFFNIGLKVRVDPRYIVNDVLQAVTAALQDAFAFDDRDLGQSVTAAEAIKVVHGVTGVIAADLTALYLFSTDPNVLPPPTPADILPARRTQWADPRHPVTALPAQLLLVNPLGVTVEEMQP
jgi:predicted phage baseplate assembly protein